MKLKTIFCHSHAWVFFEMGKFERVWIINNLHVMNMFKVR
jgi:hypothetical protein